MQHQVAPTHVYSHTHTHTRAYTQTLTLTHTKKHTHTHKHTPPESGGSYSMVPASFVAHLNHSASVCL